MAAGRRPDRQPPRQPDLLRRQPARPLRPLLDPSAGRPDCSTTSTSPIRSTSGASGRPGSLVRRGRPAGHRGAVPGRRPAPDRQPLHGLRRRGGGRARPSATARRTSRGIDRLLRLNLNLLEARRDHLGDHRRPPRPARAGAAPGPRGRAGPAARRSGPSACCSTCPARRADALEVRAMLRDVRPLPDPGRGADPDGAEHRGPTSPAFRLGLTRAEADVSSALANRFSRRLPALSAVHLPGQPAVRPEEPDLLRPRRDRRPAGLQPQPGQHLAVEAQRHPDAGRAGQPGAPGRLRRRGGGPRVRAQPPERHRAGARGGPRLAARPRRGLSPLAGGRDQRTRVPRRAEGLQRRRPATTATRWSGTAGRCST